MGKVYAEETIAAVASGQSRGGIGVVRISGPLAGQIANTVFKPHGPCSWETHRLYHGRVLMAGGRPVDDALAVLMRAPRSYTGEDVLELHCHGSPAVLRLVVESVLSAGARPALPGEFTKRAFLNGKMDLAQAEAVCDLVRARTSEGCSQAADQLFGRLSEHLSFLRKRLVRVKAHLEAQIDFAEEDLVVDRDGDLAAIRSCIAEIERMLETYRHGRLLRDGLRIAITGRPNVGKSSLLNALLGEERAIVTAIPGTTRDVVDESANFGGVPVVLSDTAGLRETADEVERLGVERALRAVEAADLALLVLDTSVPFAMPPSALDRTRTLAVLNKSDLPCRWSEGEITTIAGRYRALRVSATEGTGLDDLRRAVLELAGDMPSDGVPVLTRARHRDALVKGRDALHDALAGVERSAAPELVCVDLQAALDHIGVLTGTITNEDVLDAIFSEFCIGK